MRQIKPAEFSCQIIFFLTLIINEIFYFKEHSHTPYVIILLKYLERWKQMVSHTFHVKFS